MPPKGRTADDYDVKTDRDHIYDVPDMYIGSIDCRPKTEYIFDIETKKMIQAEITIPEGVSRITLEIISNAGDNSYFSRTEGVDPGMIHFSWNDEGYLTIKNGGLPIPIEPFKTTTPENLILVPETVFSVTKTSTNYDEAKDRIGCGRNGFGSKLTNIFSKHFIVEVGDSKRLDSKGKEISGQEYIGEWKENMSVLETSIAKPGFLLDEDGSNGPTWVRDKKDAYTGEPYVQVSWLLDFDRFKMGRKNYSKEEIGLFCRYVIEFSMTCGVPVTLNGEVHDYRDIRNFAKLFYEEDKISTSISQFCSSATNPFPKKYKSLKTDVLKEEFIATSGFIPESQILLLDTPDQGRIFSYANGLMTVDGGVHVEKLMKELFTPVAKFVNDKNKGGGTKLAIKDVKPHVSIFLICRLVNTKYNSQSKTRLENPTPNITFDDAHVKTLLSDKWDLMERLENELGAKNTKGMSKTDGKKTAHVDIENLADANKAGKGESLQCSLYVVEGKSAASYPKKRIGMLPGGKDYNGFFPLRGKPMNVTTHSPDQIAACKEFENVKKALGLKQNMDYSMDSNFKTLRYGKLIIATDADSDGMHITGLLINLFYKFWPSLFVRGFICQLITPVVRVFPKGKKDPIRFYDENSFFKWFAVHRDGFKGDITYYKGLGSSEDQDIKDDLTTAPVAIFDNDDDGKHLIQLAFDKTKADERKVWIQEWRDIRDKIAPLDLPIGKIEFSRKTSNMMGTSFPPYMIDNLFRSIPSISDGLKKSQRQVLYYALNHYKYGSNYVEGSKKGEKLISFGSGVIGYSKYHHGDKSLYDTIVKMTRDYCGSNNLPIFRPFGQFGTRDDSGKDAAQPRYNAVSFPWWYQYVFDKDMVDLVARREVDGEEAEPIWIPCDIPLGLINGSQGVATGWSTYIPSHHPIAVVDWILSRLNGARRIDPLVPFFNKFGGSIDIKMKSANAGPGAKAKAAKESTDSIVSTPSSSSSKGSVGTTSSEDDSDEFIPEFISGRGFVSTGKFIVEKEYGTKCDVHITEIPVSTSISDYLKFVKKLRVEGHIKDYRDTSDVDYVKIELYGLEEKHANIKYLKLEGGHPLSNMVMLDDDGIPKKYDSIETILSRYIINMVEMYRKYKKSIIEKKNAKISDLEMELAIIIAYLDGKLKVHKRTDEEVNANLKKLSLDQHVFDRISLRNITQSRVDILMKKVEELKDDLKIFKAKTEETLWAERLHEFKKQFIRRKVFAKEYDDSVEIDSTQNFLIDGELSLKKAHIEFVL